MKKVVKKKRKVYFGKDVQNAIIQYNTCLIEPQARRKELLAANKDVTELNYTIAKLERERDVLFSKVIFPALDKLCENVIHKWKFYNYETDYLDLKTEAVSFLFSQLHKYNPDTGSKAYSYFTIVARNFFFHKSNQVIKSKKIGADLNLIDLERDLTQEKTKTDFRDMLHEFSIEWAEWLELNYATLFKNQTDQRVCLSIAEIFKTAEEIDVFNKKMIYIYIREHAQIDNTLHITRVVKKVKEYFYPMFNEYRKEGKLICPL